MTILDALSISCCAVILIVISIIDIRKRIVPNVVILVGVVIVSVLKCYSFGIFISSIIGMVIAFGMFLALWLIVPAGIGAGDVKLAALIGYMAGFPNVMIFLPAAFIIGGLTAVLYHRKQKQSLPYAPAMALSGVMGMVAGDHIINWYVGEMNYGN